MQKWTVFVRGVYLGILLCSKTAAEEHLQGKFTFTIQEVGSTIDIDQCLPKPKTKEV